MFLKTSLKCHKKNFSFNFNFIAPQKETLSHSQENTLYVVPVWIMSEYVIHAISSAIHMSQRRGTLMSDCCSWTSAPPSTQSSHKLIEKLSLLGLSSSLERQRVWLLTVRVEWRHTGEHVTGFRQSSGSCQNRESSGTCSAPVVLLWHSAVGRRLPWFTVS